MIVACVRTGTQYPAEHVYRLRNMVKRHLPHSHRFVCLTDRPYELNSTVRTLDIAPLDLPRWWAKMHLFADWRLGERLLYFDLDTVIVGDLTPLAQADIKFGICENFTRLAGNRNWPCKYGSCVMSLAGDFDQPTLIWRRFWFDRMRWMDDFRRWGDQRVIEEIIGTGATLLQQVLPAGFFLGYRDLPDHPDAPPPGCSAVVFAGRHKPDNCNIEWVRTAWA